MLAHLSRPPGRWRPCRTRLLVRHVAVCGSSFPGRPGLHDVIPSRQKTEGRADTGAQGPLGAGHTGLPASPAPRGERGDPACAETLTQGNRPAPRFRRLLICAVSEFLLMNSFKHRERWKNNPLLLDCPASFSCGSVSCRRGGPSPPRTSLSHTPVTGSLLAQRAPPAPPTTELGEAWPLVSPVGQKFVRPSVRLFSFCQFSIHFYICFVFPNILSFSIQSLSRA